MLILREARRRPRLGLSGSEGGEIASRSRNRRPASLGPRTMRPCQTSAFRERSRRFFPQAIRARSDASECAAKTVRRGAAPSNRRKMNAHM
eukprot:1889874-Pyramimonas_sp.AAC.1